MYVNIAIDGPSGAGKSSLAKTLAKELAYIYVDTGALYRAIGLYMLKNNVKTNDTISVVSKLKEITLKFIYINDIQKVILNGEDVTDFIRTPEVSMAASNVSAIGEVREFLLHLQRDIADKNNVIMDGRDVGTVILPNADVKIFLTATPEERALRRYNELKTIEQNTNYNNVLNELNKRDHNDSTRCIAPLKPADDAVLIDNSEFQPNETFQYALKIIRSRIK